MSENTSIPAQKNFHIEEVILVLLLILSMVGIGITEHSAADGYGYWLMLVVIFSLSAILIAWLQSKHRVDDFKQILKHQSLHWLATLLIVIAAFLINKSGKLDADNASLVVLLILSLATTLDGLRVGWRFSLVGLFLGASAVVGAYSPYFLWIDLAIALVIIIVTVSWEIWSIKRVKA